MNNDLYEIIKYPIEALQIFLGLITIFISICFYNLD